jgi:hypothetical protein
MYVFEITSGDGPAERFLNLEADVTGGVVLVYDVGGRLVMRHAFAQRWHISLAAFAAGAYVVELLKEREIIMRASFSC